MDGEPLVDDLLAYITRRIEAVDAFFEEDPLAPVNIAQVQEARETVLEIERALDTLYQRAVIPAGIESQAAPLFGKDFRNLIALREQLEEIEALLRDFDGDLDDAVTYGYLKDKSPDALPGCPICSAPVPIPESHTDPDACWIGRCPEGHTHLYQPIDEEKLG